MSYNPYQQPQSPYPPPPQKQGGNFTFNTHGVIGVIAIGFMILVAFLQHWNIDWLYFVIAIVAYSAVIIASTYYKEDFIDDVRFIIGCHLAFMLLAGGLWINVGGFFIQVGIFIAAIAAGLAIPYLLTKER